MIPNFENRKILIIEDDRDIAQLLKHQLEFLGFKTQNSIEKIDSLEALKSTLWDLILLDRMLTDTNGIELCHLIRQNSINSATPVIFLTALGETNHIIEGLEAGADDYITKPFDLDILKARIQALLRRSLATSSPTTESSIYQLDLLQLNTLSCKVTVNNSDVSLTHSELTILKELFIHQGVVLTREALIEAIAGEEIHVTPRTIDTHMAALRKKISPYGNYIETIRGIGYRLKDFGEIQP